MKEIQAYALESSYVTKINIPESVEKIGACAFCNCYGITQVYFPKKLTEIGDYAFYNCNDITIYGYINSYAETYANENNIPFVNIGIKEPDSSDTYSFNEYKYRANHLTDATELGGSTVEKYINAETPSEIMVKELQKNGFNYIEIAAS